MYEIFRLELGAGSVAQVTEYCEDGSSPQVALQSPCNPYWMPGWHLGRNGQTSPKIRMEMRVVSSSQSSLRKNELEGSHFGFQTYYTGAVLNSVVQA